jgi:hypothetical protein
MMYVLFEVGRKRGQSQEGTVIVVSIHVISAYNDLDEGVCCSNDHPFDLCELPAHGYNGRRVHLSAMLRDDRRKYRQGPG